MPALLAVVYDCPEFILAAVDSQVDFPFHILACLHASEHVYSHLLLLVLDLVLLAVQIGRASCRERV